MKKTGVTKWRNERPFWTSFLLEFLCAGIGFFAGRVLKFYGKIIKIYAKWNVFLSSLRRK